MESKQIHLDRIMRENILALARPCAAAHETTLRAISRKAHGDPPCFEKIEAGTGSITGRKYDTSMAWLTNPVNWPAGAVIPEIPHPIRMGNPKATK